MRAIWRAIGLIEEWLTGIGQGVLLVIMCVVTADVGLRYFANRPIKGADELTTLMVVVVVFLTVAYTMRVGGHVRIDFIVSHLPQRVQPVIDSLTIVLELGISGLIVWQSALQALLVLRARGTTDLLHIPEFPFRLLVPLGMLLLSLELVLLLVRRVGHFIGAGNRGPPKST